MGHIQIRHSSLTEPYCISNAFGGNKAFPFGTPVGFQGNVDDNTVFTHRIRLYLDTSFTGEDLLLIRLQAGNISNLREPTGSNMARLSLVGDSENLFIMNKLYYQLPLGQSAEIYIILEGGEFPDFTDTLNPLLGNDRKGSVSFFGIRNPLYRQSAGTAGVSLTYDFSQFANLALGYLKPEADQTASGIFGGSYAALAQLTLKPSEAFGVGLTYVRSHNELTTNTGSINSNTPFGTASQSITANSYGVEATFRFSPAFTLSSWVGFSQAISEGLPSRPEADILNYAVTLAFPDIGKKGNLLGIVLGQPPKVTSNDYGLADPDTSLHLEAFYSNPRSVEEKGGMNYC